VLCYTKGGCSARLFIAVHLFTQKKNKDLLEKLFQKSCRSKKMPAFRSNAVERTKFALARLCCKDKKICCVSTCVVSHADLLNIVFFALPK